MSWNSEQGVGESLQREWGARLEEEHARFKSALMAIGNNRLSAAESKAIATHALQDGHTVALRKAPLK